MPWAKGQSGNPNGRPKTKPFCEALQLVVKRIDKASGKEELYLIAAKLLELAKSGNIEAIKEIANRLDGKSIQQLQHSGADGDAIQVIRRVIVDPKPPGAQDA